MKIGKYRFSIGNFGTEVLTETRIFKVYVGKIQATEYSGFIIGCIKIIKPN